MLGLDTCRKARLDSSTEHWIGPVVSAGEQDDHPYCTHFFVDVESIPESRLVKKYSIRNIVTRLVYISHLGVHITPRVHDKIKVAKLAKIVPAVHPQVVLLMFGRL